LPGNAARPALVVCPKSVIDVWAAEAAKFAPGLRVQVSLQGNDDGPESGDAEVEAATPAPESNGAVTADLVVMNYAQMRIQSAALQRTRWLAIILDEGQQIKNPDSKAAKVSRAIEADNRLVLTGTPIENRLLDLWSLMAFAMPGVLGPRAYFSKNFDRRKDQEAQQRLSSRLRPFLLRRTKRQVAQDLPPRTEEDVFCQMDGKQKELYQAELGRIQRVLLGLEQAADLQKNTFVILQGLMRLRQICCHPGLIDPAYMNEESAKMNALFYLLDQLRDEGHKVLVFSQFVTMLDIIKARLTAENRPFSYLTGQTKDRRGVIDHFQRTDEPNVFLLSLKAGGSGLNLTAASYVILYDPWWNPAVESQAIDRTHRIGQTQKVMAYRLLMKESVEQKIRVLQHQKQGLFTGILGQEGFTQTLTLDDVKYLFEPDEAGGDGFGSRGGK
jgi:SNF2 family DNA or RNA helicase